MTRDNAEKYLKYLLGFLVLWDVGLAVYAIGFPAHFEGLIRFAHREEPLFIRGVGMYWLFAGWIQALGCRDPRKFVVAVQLAIWFRCSAAVIDSLEVALLLPRPFYFFHYLLLFFVGMNLIIAFAEAKLLRAMGLKPFDISRK